MLKGVKQFNAAMIAFEKQYASPLIIRKIAFDILNGVVLKTPVDTGRARGNWQVGISKGSEEEVDSRTIAATIADGSSKIATVELGQAIWIFNNVPYIVFLERGSSSQAPQGMVSVTLEEITAEINLFLGR